MFERDNRIYYEGRAAQANATGDRATDPKIAALHYDLALRYAILAVQGSQARPEIVALNKARSTEVQEGARTMSGSSAEPEFQKASSRAR